MRGVQATKDGVRSADKKRHNWKKMTELDDEPGLTLWMSSISYFFSFFGLCFELFSSITD